MRGFCPAPRLDATFLGLPKKIRYTSSMAETMPTPERVRLLTASKDLTSEEADRYGDLFLGAGLTSQAMMFYERSKNPDRLLNVKVFAVAAGDAFVLHWINRLVPDLITEEEWAQAGEKALQEGKVIFARDCFEKANLPDRAQEMRQLYLGIFRTSQS
jgi:hypothetical protein